nr:DUF551 domain-containing protein [Klebsiella variicola]
MTKSTITREQRINEVKELIANAEEWAGYYEHPIHDKPQREMFEGMARVMAEHLAALTAMDSEPVILYRQVNPANGMKTYWAELDPEEFRHLKKYTDENAEFMTLYRHAQQVPVAPVCTCPSGNGSLRWPCPVHPGNSPANPGCWCRTCRPVVLNDMRFVVCPDCGNKRCPRANDHRNACTGSNEPGQEGSAYPDIPQSPGSEPATVPGKWIPVSEQMPPSRHEVLVGRWWGEKPRWCCKWATYIPGHPDAQSSGWLIPGGSWTPTHWMELPAAPQEVKGE